MADKKTEYQNQVEDPTAVSEKETVPPKYDFTDEETAERKTDSQELSVNRVGLLIAAQRDTEIRLNPEAVEQKKSKNLPSFDYDAVLQTAEKFTGLKPDEYRKAAEFQGLPLDDLFYEIGEKGRPVKEVLGEFKTAESLWTKSKKRRAVKVKGEEILMKGIQRTASGEKKVDAKDRTRILKHLVGSLDPKDRPPKIFHGSDDSGEAENAVVRPGQPGYAALDARAQSLVNADIARDPERAKMISDLLRTMGPRGTSSMVRNTIGEFGFRKLRSTISAYDLKKDAADLGIQRGTDEYQALMVKSDKNALYEATLFRAVNMFHHPGFISYDMIDPANAMGDPDDGADSLWVSEAWNKSKNARVEVIGLDEDGVAVYRLTHPVWHLFEMIDTLQMAGVGAIERVAYGPEDESFLSAVREGSLEGIETRRDFLKAALSMEAADSSTLAAVSLGFLGLGAAILTPDLLMGAAAVARATKKIAISATDLARFKRLAPILEGKLGEGAESLAKAEEILGDGLANALRSGDYDEALSLIDEAKVFALKSDEAMSATRDLDKNIASVVDQVDADIAVRILKTVAETGGIEGRRLSAFVPGGFGATMQNLHPSVRRVSLRGDSPDQLVPFYELLGAHNTLESLQDSIRLLKTGDISTQFFLHSRKESNEFVGQVRRLMADADVTLGGSRLTPAERQLVVDFESYMMEVSSTRLLRDNPSEWVRKITLLANKLPFDPDNIDSGSKFLAALSKNMKGAVKAVKAAEKTLKVEIKVADAAEATAKAAKAVQANFEARAASMAFVRERVGTQAGHKVEPLLVAVTEKYKMIGRERLSPEALDFMEQIEATSPLMKGDPALKIVKWLDQRARKWASKNDRAIREYYETRFAGVISGKQFNVPPPSITPDVSDIPPTIGDIGIPPELARPAIGDIGVPGRPAATTTARVRGAFEGPVASAPKRKPLPRLKSTPSDAVSWGKPGTMGDEAVGLSGQVIFDHLHAVEDGVEVAEFLLRHAELDSTRALIRRILPTLKKDPPKFHIMSGSDDTLGVLVPGTIGNYNGNTHVIVIAGPEYAAHGVRESTITHELLHAATSKFIFNNQQHKAVKSYLSLNTEIVEALNRRLTGDISRLSEEEAQSIRQAVNLLSNPKELLTYALTNPKFQRILSTLELAPKQTAWNKFTRLIADMFGIKSADETNALSQALLASDAVIGAAAKNVVPTKTAADLAPVIKPAGFPFADDGIEITTTFLDRAGRGGGMVVRKTEAFNSKVLRISSAEIPESLRGQGHGVDLYLQALAHAKKLNRGFLSDLNPSPDALRVYKSLEDLGVKFTRKPMKDVGGDLVDAYFIDAGDLARIDFDAVIRAQSKRSVQQPLFARIGGNFGADPVVVEFLEDGRALIKAMGDSATAEDFIRALGKVSRRDLDPKDMTALVAWLGTKGIRVGHEGALFTADDAATVEQAEAAVARAFQTYVESGRADKPAIEGALRGVLEWTKDSYASFRGAEVAGGGNLNMDKGLRDLFDKLLREPNDREVLPNIAQIVKEALFAPKVGGTKVAVMEQIVDETHRLGYPITPENLETQWRAAVEAHNAGRPGDAIIKLPGPVSFGGVYGAGKGEYSMAELITIQSKLESEHLLDMENLTALPLGGAKSAVVERSASEMVDQFMVNNEQASGSLGRLFRNMYLGGDAYADMRNLPPAVRNTIMGGVRRVQQSVGDAITLIVEGDVPNLTRYLTGDSSIQFQKGGRSAVSAGHDSVGTVISSLDRSFAAFDQDKLNILIGFVHLVKQHKGTANAMKNLSSINATPKQISAAFNELVAGDTANRFLVDAFQAAGFKGTRIDPQYLTRATKDADLGGLLETFFYLTNRVTRKDPADGKWKLIATEMADANITRRSETMFTRLYQEVGAQFPGETRVANRIAILVAGHGMAHAARMEWVKLGVAADPKLAEAVKRYLVGESVDEDMIVAVKNFVGNLGYRPQIVDGFDLAGVKMYLPEVARQRLAMALAQAQDPDILTTTKGTVFDAFNTVMASPENVISKGTNNSLALSAALLYRYMKTRMVRGHFVLKSRYFWMNTFDHFNQTAQGLGYRTALISTTRMFTQNVLSNPLGQAAVFAARRAGKGEAVEDFRRVLQAGGDKGAEWAGKMTRGSKWHVSVNDVMKGGDEIIMLGGKPYTNRQLRQTFLEGGIFASFDTSQLGTKIENVGNLFLRDAKKGDGYKQMGKDILGDMKGASEDIAEAWAERERVGLAVTLIEGGIDPRTAAKLTVEVLYDYAGSMSKGDRNFLVNLFFPFWAFQKNANRQYFDAIFSPQGAYRLGTMRRAYDKGSDYLSQLVYAASVDENGVDSAALPPELRDAYFALKTDIYAQYEVDGHVPAIIREELRLFVSGSTIAYKDGQVLQGTVLQEEIESVAHRLTDEDGNRLVIDRRALASFYVPRTDRSSLPTHYRNRIALRFPYTPDDVLDTYADPDIPGEFKDTMKTWMDAYQARRPDAPYMSLFLPEPTYVAAWNHFAHITSAMVLTLGEIENLGDKWFTDEDDGSDAVSPYIAVNAVLNPERTPIASDVAASLGVGGAQYPKRVSRTIAGWVDLGNIDILELDERDDPFKVIEANKDATESGEPTDDLPIKRPGDATRSDKVYYLMPGIGQLAFTNSPLGELNDFLIRAEKTDAENSAGSRGELQRQIRIWSGLDMRDISRDRVTSGEAWRAQKETSKLTKKKLKLK